MPKLVCVNCQTELRCETSGTTVVEMFSMNDIFQNEVYQVWQADTYKCPGCQIEIIAAFAEEPMRRHFEKNFAEWFKIIKKKARRLEYDYATPRPKKAGKTK